MNLEDLLWLLEGLEEYFLYVFLLCGRGEEKYRYVVVGDICVLYLLEDNLKY